MERTRGQKIHEVVASVVGVTSLFLTAIGYPNIGFVLGFVASLLYLTYGIRTRQYAIATSSIIYGTIEVIGIFKWTLNLM